MNFRKGDGRSRASSWSNRIAESAVKFAQKQGMDAEFSGSAWGSQYLTVTAWKDKGGDGEAYRELRVRIANHCSNGAGARWGHDEPDMSVHCETDEARLAALPAIKKAIAKLQGSL